MKRIDHLVLITGMILLLSASGVVASTPGGNCLTCHRDLESNEGPVHDFAQDIHFQKGLGCADCHGGDPTLDDMDAVRASAGFRGVPDRLDIPNFCARCHSDAAYMRQHNPALPVDQLDKYKTSIHGVKLLQAKDRKVATCVSCHTAHRIGDARMPHSSTYAANVPVTCGACHSDQAYMAGYGIPTDQAEKYRTSVHGQALYDKDDNSAPVCNDCHGNHGAAPPEVSSVSAVCGSCHNMEAELYGKSPHSDAFAAQGLPMCETCHGNHAIERPTDAMIGLADGQLCGTCHSTGDGTSAPDVIDSMRINFATLSEATDSARHFVKEASDRGMMTSDEEFALSEIDEARIHLRSGVHTASFDSLKPRFTEAITKAKTAQAGAAALVDEFYFRRWGLGISSLIITLLALGLFFKIRSIEKEQG